MVSQAQPSAPAALIRTKVLPPVSRSLVPRRGLVEALTGSEVAKLTLICAPAGFGKSSLLAAWAGASWEDRPFAWFAIDEMDDDPKRFWAYAIESLRRVDAAIGALSARMLQAPGPPLLDRVLLELINEIADADRPMVLALDDYHAVTDLEIHQSVTLLVEHLPPGLHLVVATRSEPSLPLARWRARGQLAELDAARLRFSAAETEAFLNDLLGLGLDRADLITLRERTEGWPAGLYLAALSIRDQADRHSFITQFAGTDRYVIDYLGEEVLRARQDSVRDFLLRTSVLDRLSAPLCDAVTGTAASASLLREIERSNLFLIPLDTRREWYRYHHLFRSLLAHEARAREPGLLPELHRRAARWLLEGGFTADGIRHTIASGDVDRACELIAVHWSAFLGTGDDRAIAAWLDALPGDAVMADARVCVAGAMVALSLNRLDEATGWVRKAERARQPGPFADGFGSLPAATAFVRASHGLGTGDLGAGRSAAQQAVALLAETSPWRQLALCTWGLSAYLLGRTGEGLQALEEGRRAGRITGMGLNLDLILASLGGSGPTRDGWRRPSSLPARRSPRRPRRAASSTGGTGSPTWSGRRPQTSSVTWPKPTLRRPARWSSCAAAGRSSSRRRCQPRPPSSTSWATATPPRSCSARPAGSSGDCPDPGIVPELIDTAERRLRRPPARRGAGSAAEPLTDREAVILRMLASQLSQREIGQELFVTLNTVKFHTRSIFRKLGVSTRAEAVARARELGLL